MSGRASRAWEMFVPWAGLALGGSGFFFAHQMGSDNVFSNCALSSPVIVWIAAISGLLMVSGGGAISWSVGRRAGETAARKLVAHVSLMASGLFAFAIILPMIASALIPACHA